MQLCDRHDKQVRAALDTRELLPLVSDNVESLKMKIVDAAVHGVTIHNYDPNLHAVNVIFWRAINTIGIWLLFEDVCPLCYMTTWHDKHCDDPTCKVTNFDDWIDAAAAQAQVQVRQLLANMKTS